MEFLNTIQPWHWLIIAFLLLGAEALGAGGFLLGSAAAAFLVAGAIGLSSDLSWAWQMALFGLFSLLFTIAYWKFFKNLNERSDHPELNNRASQLIGCIFELEQDLPNAQGRVQLGDTFWKVQASKPLEKGTLVAVTGSHNMTLIIEERGR
ncbi:NfeD family protein [Endozoicomonas sp. Mp262]|uniref:NfeD family protein n=1 Tax=Endozoicomonas sp. Mp262 TaxID=2919499 RepID=UPI0021DB6A39